MQKLFSTKSLGALAVVATFMATTAFGGSILIINGAAETTEPTTTADLTANLKNLEIAAGNTVTIDDMAPASLAGF
jgi:hypothetical protein